VEWSQAHRQAGQPGGGALARGDEEQHAARTGFSFLFFFSPLAQGGRRGVPVADWSDWTGLVAPPDQDQKQNLLQEGVGAVVLVAGGVAWLSF